MHARARATTPSTSPLVARSEFKFARQRLAAEAGDDVELCRANLTARVERCDVNCDACGAHCASKTVRDIVGVAKCSVALPILGFLQAQHSSDLGLVRKHRALAVSRAPHPHPRTRARLHRAAPALHAAGHRVPVGRQALRHAPRQPQQQLRGEVPRPRAEQRRRALRAAQLPELPVQFAHRPAADAPSRAHARAHRPPRPDARCAGSRTASRPSAPTTRRSTRRATRWSARASTCRATPTSTASAAAEVRRGPTTPRAFARARASSTALRSEPARPPVAAHPVSGMHFVCTHNAQLYTTAGLSKKAYEQQVAANVQLKAAGEPHPKIWLPDSNNEDYYLLEMPGSRSRTQTLPHPRFPRPLPRRSQATTSTTSSEARACAPTCTTTTCTRAATRRSARRSPSASRAAGRRRT